MELPAAAAGEYHQTVAHFPSPHGVQHRLRTGRVTRPHANALQNMDRRTDALLSAAMKTDFNNQRSFVVPIVGADRGPAAAR